VATDQKTAPTDDVAKGVPAIDNEIITYRAISGMAVVSVVCGILASFSFASLYFLAFSVAAIGAGFLALRSIKRFPDMFTGRGLANAGITLGLVLGLAAYTYEFVTNYVRTSDAGRFAKHYAEVMKTGSLGDILLLDMNPAMRKGKSAKDAESDLEAAQAKPKEKMSMDQRITPIRTLRKRLAASPNENFHFVDIEGHGIEETHGAAIQYYAFALFEAEGPGSKEFPETKQYALAILKGQPAGRSTEWWVDDIKFPYVPQTYALPTQAADDGHGHPH
jgi:hypothetical protein